MDKSSLVYPMFVKDGENIKEEIPTMPGQFRYSVDRMPEILCEMADAGVNNIMLFGIPDHKDELGSGAYACDGIIQKALEKAKKEVPQLLYIGDVCMCEYTSHGHCGILKGEYVDNDLTLEKLAEIAVSQVQAGADMVAPSDMIYPAPRITSWAARVTTKGNMLNFAINTPFNSPNRPHIKTETAAATKMLLVYSNTTPITTLVSASMEPMERSMPPAVMTNTMPRANTPFTDICCKILITLPDVRNVGDAMHMKTIIARRMMAIPYFFINTSSE